MQDSTLKITSAQKAEGVAHVLECLPNQLKVLSSQPMLTAFSFTKSQC
jgi:hypothetical protein